MVTTVAARGSGMREADEQRLLDDAERLLRESRGDVFLEDEHGNRVGLPESVVRLVRQVVQTLARGNQVEVTAVPKVVSVQRAAEMLDLRPEDVVRLIDQGDIPAVQDGAFRRIRYDDVLAYRPRRDADRRESLAELVRLSEEMGLYDLDDEESREVVSDRADVK
jgi:excisionase family DNA binding protein